MGIHVVRRNSCALSQRRLFLAATVVVAACSDPANSPERSKSNLDGMLVGTAAAGLKSDGRFELAGPPEGSHSTLAADEAVALAAVWTIQFGPFFQRTLERGHGASIDVPHLKPCGPPLFAEGAFQLPIQGIADVYTRPFGSWWLIGLCDPQGTTQVSLAISATATGLWIEDGRIRKPRHSGNEFIPAGVPAGWSGPVGESAEAAVARAFPHTKRRIASVPRLIAPSLAEALPQSASWLLVLESPTSLKEKSSGRQIQASEVYVGPRSYMGRGGDGVVEVNVPALQQTDSLSFEYKVAADPASPRFRAFAHRRPEVPVTFEPTAPIP